MLVRGNAHAIGYALRRSLAPRHDAGGDPQFDGTDVAGKCLFDLKGVAELCSPASLSNIPVDTAIDEEIDLDLPEDLADISASWSATTTRVLVCYKAKLASRLANATSAALTSANAGDKLPADQVKHPRRAAKTGDPVYTVPNNLPAPTSVDTKGQKMLCIPTDLRSVAP